MANKKKKRENEESKKSRDKSESRSVLQGVVLVVVVGRSERKGSQLAVVLVFDEDLDHSSSVLALSSLECLKGCLCILEAEAVRDDILDATTLLVPLVSRLLLLPRHRSAVGTQTATHGSQGSTAEEANGA